MSLTQAVAYIDREQLGLTTSTLSSQSPRVLYVKFILKTESQNVWFGSISENGWQELL